MSGVFAHTHSPTQNHASAGTGMPRWMVNNLPGVGVVSELVRDGKRIDWHQVRIKISASPLAAYFRHALHLSKVQFSSKMRGLNWISDKRRTLVRRLLRSDPGSVGQCAAVISVGVGGRKEGLVTLMGV